MNISLKILNLVFIGIITLLISGCGAIKHKPGESFYADIFTTGKTPSYIKEGNYLGNDFYVTNPAVQQYYEDAGLLVRNSKVIKDLTPQEVENIRAALREQTKAAAEKERVEKLKEAQLDKQKKLKVELDQQARIKELKSRKYSMLPAKIKVESRNLTDTQRFYGLGLYQVIVTSIDNEPFLIERVVVNNKAGEKDCDKAGLVEYMTTGDTRQIAMGNCGNTLVKVDVYTNRGSSTYQFK